MAKTAQSRVEEQAEASDLVVMATANPLAIYTDPQQFSDFYKRLKEETDRHVADISTDRGRAAVRSLAYKVTRAKTTLDKAGLGLTLEWRQKIEAVNTARKQMVTELDALAEEVRRPLTEWEEAEKERVAECRAVIDRMKAMALVDLDDTAATVRQRGKELWEIEIGERFGDMAEEAREAKATAVATLQRALDRLTKEEAERAELERLRAEAAEREAREAAEREERERAERERLEAEEAERRRLAAEEAERQRIAEAEARAAQAAREEEARRAREAEEARQREHEAALAEERRQREEAERVAREEREAREAEDVRRAEERRRFEEARAAEAEEARRREADREHRAKIIAEAADAIAKIGVTKKLAENVVRAIIAGEVPAVSLRF